MKTESQINSQIYHQSTHQIKNNKKYEHLQKLQQVYKKNSYLPSIEMKYYISKILEEIKQQKYKIQSKIDQEKLIKQTISQEELLKYQFIKEQKKQNQSIIVLLKKSKQLLNIVENEINQNHNSIGLVSDQHQNINKFQSQLNKFAKLIKSLQEFDLFFTQAYLQQHDTNNPKEKKFIEQNSTFLKNFYKNVVDKVLGSNQFKNQTNKLQKILQKYQLPLKRTNKAHKPSIMDPNSKQKINQNDKDLLVQILHRQACEYALVNFVSSLIQDENFIKYNSGFFNIYYSKINEAINYLFIDKNESHNVEQPNWMFDYIHETFNMNYLLMKQTILLGLDHQIQGNILIYILQYSIQQLFYENIKKRFQTDIQSPNIHQIKQSYLYFRFIDTLHELEQKLSISFSQQISLLQNILIEFQIKKKHLILQKNFDYEHKWIEEKIFNDFYDINYSQINIKNIQAYNIITNFNILFERLYNKFNTVYDQTLRNKIHQFYQNCIKNLIGHLKTSCQRIYYHSGCDKLDIVLAFKRVDNEFRSGLSHFITKDLQFEKYVKQEYYDYLISLFNVYALEELSKYHRKILKLTTQNEKYFSSENVSQESQHIIQKSLTMCKSWQKKLIELNSVYSYKDSKIKNMFYSFMDSTQFSSNGIVLFLQFFKPYLILFYSVDAFNILKMVILMEKREQLNYLQLNRNILGFLLDSQIEIIKRVKVKQ